MLFNGRGDQLLKEIELIQDRIKIFPFKTDALVYNPEYTPEWIIEHLNEIKTSKKKDDLDWLNGGCYYQKIFDEYHKATEGPSSEIKYLCTGFDIGEDYPNEDYTYYYGFLHGKFNAKGIAFLFAEAVNEFEFASRLIFYTHLYQIELIGISKYIEIFEINPQVRNLFFTQGDKNKVKEIIQYLKETDRPIKDPEDER